MEPGRDREEGQRGGTGRGDREEGQGGGTDGQRDESSLQMLGPIF